MANNIGIAADALDYPNAEPFLKWAGGKRSLLPELLPRVPAFDRYFEPFVGGGALFFALHNEGRLLPWGGKKYAQPRAFLNDINQRLVRTYRAIQGQRGVDVVESVIAKLRRKKNDKDFFLRERARAVDKLEDADVAAWMIYLNRTCFNGLYRVNREGKFNVPFGGYKNPRICNAENLRACAYALGTDEAGDQHVKILSTDFEVAVGNAAAGDFVYFDPPYLPRTDVEFTNYDVSGFGLKEHERLRDVALRLKKRGVKVLISNSGADDVRRLYRRGFRIHEVKGDRRIGAQSNWRGQMPDLLIS